MADFRCIICEEIIFRVPGINPELVQYIACPYGAGNGGSCNLVAKRSNCGLCREAKNEIKTNPLAMPKD